MPRKQITPAAAARMLRALHDVGLKLMLHEAQAGYLRSMRAMIGARVYRRTFGAR